MGPKRVRGVGLLDKKKQTMQFRFENIIPINKGFLYASPSMNINNNILINYYNLINHKIIIKLHTITITNSPISQS